MVCAFNFLKGYVNFILQTAPEMCSMFMVIIMTVIAVLMCFLRAPLGYLMTAWMLPHFKNTFLICSSCS